MSATGEYRPGDEGYASLRTKWIAEGSAGEFEVLGDEGGARFRVHNRNAAGGPTFLLTSAAEATSTGYDETTEKFKSPEWPGPRKGYEFESRDVGLDILGGAQPGQLRIETEPPPRNMTAAEAIVADLEE